MTRNGDRKSEVRGRSSYRKGRGSALAILDQLLAENRTEGALEAAFQKMFDEDPVMFFKKMVMPLLPREAELSVETDRVIRWVPLSDDSAATGKRPEVRS
jgi:hypothetical protein